MALVKYNNNSISGITSAPNVGSGNITLIKTITASSDSTISFVDGSSDVVLDNTYPIYLFKLINIHPGTDNVHLQVNFSTNSGSNYNVTKTSTSFAAYHQEDAGDAALTYSTSRDLAQGSGVQRLVDNIGAADDECTSGELFLFNPYSNEFVKNFLAEFSQTNAGEQAWRHNVSGYCNTTSAVTGARFLFGSGNVDAGTIKMYGVT